MGLDKVNVKHINILDADDEELQRFQPAGELLRDFFCFIGRISNYFFLHIRVEYFLTPIEHVKACYFIVLIYADKIKMFSYKIIISY